MIYPPFDKRGLQCGCPSKQEDYIVQVHFINRTDEGAEGQKRLAVSTEVTQQSRKVWSNQKLQSLPNKASTITLGSPGNGLHVCLAGI